MPNIINADTIGELKAQVVVAVLIDQHGNEISSGKPFVTGNPKVSVPLVIPVDTNGNSLV